MSCTETARTSYFKIKNPNEFLYLAFRYDLEFEKKGEEYCLFFPDGVNSLDCPETGDFECEVADFLMGQIAEGEVGVLTGAWGEGVRGMGGFAWVFTSEAFEMMSTHSWAAAKLVEMGFPAEIADF